MTLRGLFVAGTDTGVGKTRVAAAIARDLAGQGRRVGVLKPLATGATRVGDSWRCDDAEALIAAIGGGIALDRVVPFLYEEPLAPAVAARRQGAALDPQCIKSTVREAIGWWAARADVVVVEGVGGLLTPLAPRMTLVDLAESLDYPLVIVARRGLGTLNQTLMTVECCLRRGLRVAGVVLNSVTPAPPGLAEATNADELSRWLEGIPILAEVPYFDDPEALRFTVPCVDWYDRSLGPRRSDPGDAGFAAIQDRRGD